MMSINISLDTNIRTMKMIKNKIKTIIKYLTVLMLILCNVQFLAAEFSMENYIIESGDKIKVSVFDEPELSSEILLDDRGIVNYPLVRTEVKISGLTLRQIEDKFKQLFISEELLKKPSVQVTVVEYRPFFINGEINNPGGYPYQPGLNVGKAISVAGGFTERASKSSIYVSRNRANRTKITLNSPIFPGDEITIEESFF